jgi:hypothetical protein
MESAFRSSRWFTRGWTLQELLAPGPGSVEFFSQEGDRLGDKRTLEQQIHEITGITITVLRGTPLSQFDVNYRLRLRQRCGASIEEQEIIPPYLVPPWWQGPSVGIAPSSEMASTQDKGVSQAPLEQFLHSHRRQQSCGGRSSVALNQVYKNSVETKLQTEQMQEPARETRTPHKDIPLESNLEDLGQEVDKSRMDKSAGKGKRREEPRLGIPRSQRIRS